MGDFEIVEGTAPQTRGKGFASALRELYDANEGDNILFPLYAAKSIRAMISRHWKGGFTTRMEEEGIRVWRV